MAPQKRAVGVEPWDTEWAAERAAEALRYLGRNYPECLDALRALDALDGSRVDVVGTSGFTTREDTILCTETGAGVMSVHKNPAKLPKTKGLAKL
jgi:hypothetical protein